MEWQVYELNFSQARMQRYLSYYNGDQAKAIEAYDENIRLAQSLVPLLNVFELALRNAVHNLLTKKFARQDWWQALHGQEFADLSAAIRAAQYKLERKKDKAYPDKIVAELNFGFWTSLFNVRYQSTFWHTLRLVFPHCPKTQRQRQNIAASLNAIRELRNRVFHHESLLWLKPDVDATYNRGLGTLAWIDPRLVDCLTRYGDVRARWPLNSRIRPPGGVGHGLVSLIQS